MDFESDALAWKTANGGRLRGIERKEIEYHPRTRAHHRGDTDPEASTFVLSRRLSSLSEKPSSGVEPRPGPPEPSRSLYLDAGPPPTLRKVPSHGGEPVTVRTNVATVLDCSPDGVWISARGRTGFVVVSTDGKEERVIASVGDEYASQADNTMQFGEGGRVLYLLRRDRQ